MIDGSDADIAANTDTDPPRHAGRLLGYLRELDGAAMGAALGALGKHEPTEHCSKHAEYAARPFCFAYWNPPKEVFGTKFEGEWKVLRFADPGELTLVIEELRRIGVTVACPAGSSPLIHYLPRRLAAGA